MKSYTELNNSKRTQCSIKKDKIGVQLYKLISNSTFRRQMENVKKYKDIRIVNNEKKVKKQQQNQLLEMFLYYLVQLHCMI